MYPTGLPLESSYIINWIYRFGSIFVELFLVISGFSAFVAYTEKIDRGMKLSRYALKRAIRIYPLMIATFLITLVEQLVYLRRYGAYFWGGDNTLTTIIFSLLGIQSLAPGGAAWWNSPSWSLSLFFLCWLIYYLIIHFTKDRQDKDTIRIVLCAAIVLLGIGLRRKALEQVLFFNKHVARAFISFFSGGLVYYIYKATGEHDKRVITASAAVLLGLFICRYLGVEVGDSSIVFGAAMFPAALLLVLKSRFIGALLSFRPFTYLGKISFSIYLCNFPIEIAIDHLDKALDLQINHSSLWFFFAFFVIHIVVASIMCPIFEKKVPDALKRKFNI